MVSLAIVGTVAALTTPMLFNNVQEARQKAAFKETITSLQQLLKQGVDGNELPTQNAAGFDTYMNAKLNATARCPLNAGPTSCVINGGAGIGIYFDGTYNFYTLPSGVVVGWDMTRFPTSTYAVIAIDLNGANPPNLRNKDIVFLKTSLIADNQTTPWPCPNKPTLRGGEIDSLCTDAGDFPYYDKMMAP